MARYYGAYNQAEEGAPSVSIFGQALKRAVGAGKVVLDTKRDDMRPTPDGHLSEYARADNIGNSRQFAKVPWGFRNFFGAFVARPAVNHTVANPGRGYAGILPLSEQPSLFKPKPWNDPTLGSP